MRPQLLWMNELKETKMVSERILLTSVPRIFLIRLRLVVSFFYLKTNNFQGLMKEGNLFISLILSLILF